MSPIQQMLLGVGAVATKTFVDDVFSTFLFKGNSSTQTITNGIDLSGQGGLVWSKTRDASDNHRLTDTVRGANKTLSADATFAEFTNSGVQGVSQFNSNGFVSGLSDSSYNNDDIASWTFRKSPGFFDICTWTGNSTTNRVIPHDLECVPGSIWIKCITHGEPWTVYHRQLTSGKTLRLDSTAAETATEFMGTSINITSTGFTVGHNNEVNGDSAKDYIAYVFAGGESTAANARSVSMSGSSGSLEVASSSDFAFGTGAFTVEFWIYLESVSNYVALFEGRPNSTNGDYFSLGLNNGKFDVYVNSSAIISISDATKPATGQWTHVAVVREGTGTDQLKLYMNGQLAGKTTNATNYGNQRCLIAGHAHSRGNFTGKVSNYRVVKGTAVYTSSFRPPTEPLTSITNTVLLCCNNSSVTGKTTGGTITATGSPTASTDSPFDDSAGFVFGDSGDQNVIKCGSYVGNANADGPEINLGWEPQWLLFKNTASSTAYWELLDNMRGLASGGNGYFLAPNAGDSESFRTPLIDLTPTGFKIRNNNDNINGNNQNIIYIAIRRPDGYVSKPPELGTGVFAMGTSTGNSGDDIDSGFPVDFGFAKRTATAEGWYTSARLMEGLHLYTDTTAAEASNSYFPFDNNVGWTKGLNAGYQAFMWKRHAGFDVVTYTGNGTAGRQVPHSLSKVPEMLWVKNREGSDDPWKVYHKGLDNGNNPEEHNIELSGNYAEGDSTVFWNDTAPTATHFTVGTSDAVNEGSKKMIAILFSSISGISAVGSYTGTGVSGNTITGLGFAPRFVIIKNASRSSTSWVVLDTLRGWGSGDDKSLELNDDNAQETYNYGAPTSTGFTLEETGIWTNYANDVYIYYAHS